MNDNFQKLINRTIEFLFLRFIEIAGIALILYICKLGLENILLHM